MRVDDRVAETSAGCRSVTSGCRSELALNSRNNGNIDECWFLRESVGERGGGSGTAARNDSLKNPWGLPGLEVADDDVRDREVMFVELSMLELVPCRRLAGLWVWEMEPLAGRHWTWCSQSVWGACH